VADRDVVAEEIMVLAFEALAAGKDQQSQRLVELAAEWLDLKRQVRRD